MNEISYMVLWNEKRGVDGWMEVVLERVTLFHIINVIGLWSENELIFVE